MKKTLLISFFSLLSILQVAAQVTTLAVTTTVTAATACTPPCNGTATAIVSGGTPPYTYLWNIPPSGQQTQTATGLCPGQYQVGVWDASFAQGTTLATITCNTASGITSVSFEENITVYPNPAFNELIVETGSLQPGSAEFVVRNVLGNTVSAGMLDIGANASGKLNISSLPSGVYTVEIQDKGVAIRTKFIKE